jgi:hypothetical protein
LHRLHTDQEVVLAPLEGDAITCQVVAVGGKRAWMRAASILDGLRLRSWPPSDQVYLTFRHRGALTAVRGRMEFGRASRDVRFRGEDGVLVPERRQDPRADVALAAELTDQESGATHEAVTLDLSRGGARVRSEGRLESGRGYQLRLNRSAEEPPVVVSARVIRSDQGVSRLAFDGLDGEAAARLESWVLAAVRAGMRETAG